MSAQQSRSAAVGVATVLIAALVGCGESSTDDAATPQSKSSSSGSEVASGAVGDSGVSVSGVVDGVPVTATVGRPESNE
jgi:hypothetical protein